MTTYAECRTAASKMGERNDCVVRAIACAFDLPYERAHELCRQAGRRKGRGMFPSDWRPLVDRIAGRKLTWHWVSRGLTVRTFERLHAAPRGVYLVLTSGHLLCVKDGVAEDFTSGRRHRVISWARVS